MTLSLKTKILLPMALAALALIAVGVGVGVISLRQVTDQRFEADFSARLSTLRAFIATQQKALDDTQMASTLDEQFRASTIETLRGQYYKDGDTQSFYPFIFDPQGIMLMHPVLKAGDASLKDEAFVARMLTGKTGMQNYVFKGDAKWMMFDLDPRWGWSIGYAIPTSVKYAQMRRGAFELTLAMVVVGLVVVAVLFVLLSRWVTHPMTTMVTTLRDAGSSMPHSLLDRSDELGLLAQAMTRSVVGMRQAQEAQAAEAAKAEATVKARLDEVLGGVAAHSDTLRTTSAGAASAATELSTGVNTVATSTEEMAASSREIAKNTGDAARITAEAAGMTKDVDAAMGRLGQSNQQIGEVLKTIQTIASQTNLLALNATIEAARAGDAGRGFAVVASEVKALAQQTASATSDIAQRINAVQTDAKAATEAIQRINAIIARIDQIQQTISSAVEEQSATTSEMSRSISEAARGTSEIAQQINELASLSAKLQELVRR